MTSPKNTSKKKSPSSETADPKSAPTGTWSEWFTFVAVWGFIRLFLLFPYRIRLSCMAWLSRWIIGPLAGYRDRCEANLAYIWPDVPAKERRHIANNVLRHAGRSLIENFDINEQLRRSCGPHVQGPGLAAIEKAQAEKRPVLLLTGHFGNYTAVRSAIAARGYKVAALYRPWSNPYLNRHYMEYFDNEIGPAFPQGRRGTIGLVRYLHKGGIGALLFDVYDSSGIPIDFLGKPAPTLTSAADLALKTGALLVPCFSTRAPNEVDCEIYFHDPIEYGTPEEMTKKATRLLEERIMAHPDQWFWIHRRWKPRRQKKNQRKLAAANMGPKSGA